MKISELLDMPLRDVLDEFCILYSAECDWYYGIGRWDDLSVIEDEYQLEEELCFLGDHLLDYAMEIDFDDDVKEVDDLRKIMDCLGIEKKE